MEDKTMKRILIGTAVFLGVTYVLDASFAAKKRRIQIENSNKSVDDNGPVPKRKYYTIANTVLENGKIKIKSIRK